jgi:hypothetical protein
MLFTLLNLHVACTIGHVLCLSEHEQEEDSSYRSLWILWRILDLIQNLMLWQVALED